jgi:hypothetical protein
MAITISQGQTITNGVTLKGNGAAGSIPLNNIVVYLDAANPSSYPGTGSTWTDLSGQSNNATLYGVNYSSDNLGQFVFNGSGQYAGIAPGFGYDYSAGVTVIAWAKFSSLSGGAWQRIIDFGNGTPANNIILCRNGGGGSMVMSIEGVNDTALVPGEMTIHWDQWAMYAMTADGSSWKEWGNGALLSTQSNTSLLPATVTRNNNYIGRSNWSSDSYFMGSISMLLMYNRALSADEISSIYRATSWRYTQ